MSDAAHRSVSDLSDEERARLEAAHRELREAVAVYDDHLGREVDAAKPVPTAERSKLHDAQRAIERAEERLWSAREELLGWARPHWAPGAALTADWFSDEDAIYDDLPEATLP